MKNPGWSKSRVLGLSTKGPHLTDGAIIHHGPALPCPCALLAPCLLDFRQQPPEELRDDVVVVQS